MKKLTKGDMIREIMLAVNANAEQSKDTNNPTKKSDANLFFSLAFCTEDELHAICKKTKIIN